ncbi:hypothetical protein KCU77_g53, partial [Aureobasidium melanogenum]
MLLSQLLTSQRSRPGKRRIFLPAQLVVDFAEGSNHVFDWGTSLTELGNQSDGSFFPQRVTFSGCNTECLQDLLQLLESHDQDADSEKSDKVLVSLGSNENFSPLEK